MANVFSVKHVDSERQLLRTIRTDYQITIPYKGYDILLFDYSDMPDVQPIARVWKVDSVQEDGQEVFKAYDIQHSDIGRAIRIVMEEIDRLVRNERYSERMSVNEGENQCKERL